MRAHRAGLADVEEEDEEATEQEQRQTLPASDSQTAIRVLVPPTGVPGDTPPPPATAEMPHQFSG